MPAPTDSHYLLRSLVLLVESAERRRTSVEETLQEIAQAGIEDVVKAFADAAVRAGMPSSRAANYAEEYSASVGIAKDKIEAAVTALNEAGRALTTAAHIARVVPPRCPNAGGGADGVKVLEFT